MAKPLRPFVRGGGYYPSKKWIPLVRNGGYTTQNGGETEPVWATASGAIASFTTPFAYPLKKLVAQINPVQDLHGYDSPWPEGGGVNKLPPAASYSAVTVNGVTVTPYPDGHYHLEKGAATENNATIRINLAKSVPVSAGMYFAPICATKNANVVIDINDSAYNRTATGFCGKASTEITDAGTGVAEVITLFVVASQSNLSLDIYPLISETALDVFSPYSNICPISGWTGCEVYLNNGNQWDGIWEEGSIDGSTGQNESASGFWRTKNYIPIKPDTTYYVVCSVTGSLRARFYDSGKNYLGTSDKEGAGLATNRTFTAPSNACFVRFAPNGSVLTTKDVSVNYPSTDTEYHAYNGNSYSVIWEDEVFGGSAEVVEGKRINDRTKLKLLSSFAWQADGTTGSDKRFGFPYFSNPSIIRAINQNGTYISNMLAPGNIGLNSHEFGTFYISNSWIVIHDKNSHFATLDDFKDWLDSEDVYLVYKIATPVETTITPTPITALKGYNAVLSDAGPVEVTAYGTPIVEPNVPTRQALNLLLGGAYRNDQTEDDVSDEEALDILLGGADR